MFNLNKKVLFIVPNNDGEAVEIQKLLKDNKCNYLVTNQAWGASWYGLEEDIKNEINSGKYSKIYGVELQGELINKSIQLKLNKTCDIINIDHHKYNDEDRSNKLSSLEQVANILNVELTDYQNAVSDNDKGYIDLMIKNGCSQEIINKVRLQDRTAQGITEEQDKQAEESINNMEVLKYLTIINLPHSKCATVTDRLYGNYKNLLIICVDGETDFYGNGNICLSLQEKFGGWIGGQLPTYGFWGGYVNQEEVREFVVSLL